MKKKNRNGMNKQGIRTLDHLPSRSVGVRLEFPPGMVDNGCVHPLNLIKLDKDGDKFCGVCHCPLF
jgi:hypothetical protein